MSEPDSNLPEKREPEEIPELDPEVIPSDEPPYGDFDHRPLGGGGMFQMNLNCCGCSGTTLLFVIAAVALLVYFLFLRSHS